MEGSQRRQPTCPPAGGAAKDLSRYPEERSACRARWTKVRSENCLPEEKAKQLGAPGGWPRESGGVSIKGPAGRRGPGTHKRPSTGEAVIVAAQADPRRLTPAASGACWR